MEGTLTIELNKDPDIEISSSSFEISSSSTLLDIRKRIEGILLPKSEQFEYSVIVVDEGLVINSSNSDVKVPLSSSGLLRIFIAANGKGQMNSPTHVRKCMLLSLNIADISKKHVDHNVSSSSCQLFSSSTLQFVHRCESSLWWKIIKTFNFSWS